MCLCVIMVAISTAAAAVTTPHSTTTAITNPSSHPPSRLGMCVGVFIHIPAHMCEYVLHTHVVLHFDFLTMLSWLSYLTTLSSTNILFPLSTH